MDTIISKSNEKVKFIKSLNEKKFRQKYKAFYIEGIKVVKELLKNIKAIDLLFIAYSKELLKDLNGGNNIIKRLEDNIQIEKYEFSKELFKYMTDTVTPQGILVVIRIKEKTLDDLLLGDDIIILDKIQDAR